MNLGLNIIDSIRGLDLEGDGLASECLDEDLHDTKADESRQELVNGARHTYVDWEK